jgi:hypothetical protein
MGQGAGSRVVTRRFQATGQLHSACTEPHLGLFVRGKHGVDGPRVRRLLRRLFVLGLLINPTVRVVELAPVALPLALLRAHPARGGERRGFVYTVSDGDWRRRRRRERRRRRRRNEG